MLPVKIKYIVTSQVDGEVPHLENLIEIRSYNPLMWTGILVYM